MRKLGPLIVASKETIGGLAGVRHLRNGQVLVNDQVKRRIVLLDSSLDVIAVVADASIDTRRSYGRMPGGLIPYRADSTLLVDPATMSMIVVDPKGKLTRTMAAPRPREVMSLIGTTGNPGFDAKGRLVYRNVDVGIRVMRAGEDAGSAKPTDMAPVVRLDLETKKLDTAAMIRVAQDRAVRTTDPDGAVWMKSILHPLPTVDEWAVLSDGTIAIVRGRDYHVDLIDADGTLRVGAKIPYQWERFKDDDAKRHFLDSARIALDVRQAAATARNATRTDGDQVRQGAQTLDVIAPSELGDYKPVFGSFGVRADMDGRLWVRTIPGPSVSGGVIHDVIDRNGTLVDRVQIPSSMVIIGFGAGGVVYLGGRQGMGVHLYRAALK